MVRFCVSGLGMMQQANKVIVGIVIDGPRSAHTGCGTLYLSCASLTEGRMYTSQPASQIVLRCRETIRARQWLRPALSVPQELCESDQ